MRILRELVLGAGHAVSRIARIARIARSPHDISRRAGEAGMPLRKLGEADQGGDAVKPARSHAPTQRGRRET